MDLGSRSEYTKGTLDEHSLAQGPWHLLESWIHQAESMGLPDPSAFVLSTTDDEGVPHGRVVLLRGTRNGELVFFTNYDSEKGRDLRRDPRAGATFFWPQMERQIRVRGSVSKLNADESDAYFHARPRNSQLGAWASKQSNSIESRDALEAQFNKFDVDFAQRDVPRPSHWGGYAIRPEVIEFWQGRASRMHDRLRCQKASDGTWSITRLQP